jgi:hypothetical protein
VNGGVSSGAPVQEIVVRVGIPHFFREDGGGPGNGSRRPGARQSRALALARCLAGLQRLCRGGRDAVLHIGDHAIDHLPPEEGLPPLPPLRLEIVVCSDGQHLLEEVLREVQGPIRLETLRPNDPVLLPLACRDLLIHSDPIADLTLYLEDDLVIDDAEYVDKQLWFLHQSEHRLSLMPHRFERVDQNGFGRLLVDGPLREDDIRRFVRLALESAGHAVTASSTLGRGLIDAGTSRPDLVVRSGADVKSLGKVAKFYYTPGFWEGSAALHTIVSQKAWDSLPPSYKAALQAASAEATVAPVASNVVKTDQGYVITVTVAPDQAGQAVQVSSLEVPAAAPDQQ